MLSSDWWLKKALKFALKRYLGRLLQVEDTDQLEVQLGQEFIELKDVVLKCKYLNEQLGDSQWTIMGGMVGRLRLLVPMTRITSEPCTLQMDKVLLTMGLKPSNQPPPSHQHGSFSAEEADSSPVKGFFDFEDGPMGPSAITKGIAKIAGGMENILQKLKIQATEVGVIVKLDSDEKDYLVPVVKLKLQSFCYEGVTPDSNEAPQGTNSAYLQLEKDLTFSGLTIELFEDELEETVAEQPLIRLEDPKQTLNNPSRVRWADEMAIPSDRGVPGTDRGRTIPGSADIEAQLSEDDLPAGSEDGWQDFSSKEFEEIPGSPGVLVDVNEAPRDPDLDDPLETRHIIICDREGIGCSGSLKVELVWQTQTQTKPHIRADLVLNPLQVQLHPHHLPLIASLATIVSRAASRQPSAVDGMESQDMYASQSRLFTNIMMPDTVTLAQDLVYESWYHDKASAGSGAASEYHDAESLLGSLRSGLTSFASASASGLAQGASYFSLPLSGFEGSESVLPQAPEVGKIQVKMTTQDLSLVLWYQQEKRSLEEDWLATDDYRPRLSLEVGDVMVKHESTKTTSSSGVQVFRVEAVEHIPMLPSAVTLPHQTLTEMVQLGEVMPPHPGLTRQVPTFSGVCMSPMPMSMYASMLSQVSSLSASAGPNTQASHSVQITPVLCIAGSVKAARGTPSLALTMESVLPKSESAEKGTKMDVKVRSASAWLGIPLLARLHAFLEPLIVHLGTQPAAQNSEGGAGESRHTGQSDKVGREIDTLISELHELGPKSLRAPPAKRTQLTLSGSFVGLTLFMLPDRSSSLDTYVALELAGAAGGKAGQNNLNVAVKPQPGGASEFSASVGLAHARAYLIRSEGTSQEGAWRGNSQKGDHPILTCTSLLDMSGSAMDSLSNHAPLSVDLTWKSDPQQASPVCDRADAYARQCAQDGGSVENAEGSRLDLQDAMLKPASLICHLQTSHLRFNLCRADLSALSLFGRAYSEWQTHSAASVARALGLSFPYTQCSPTVFILDCGLAAKQTGLARQAAGHDVGLECHIDPQRQGAAVAEVSSNQTFKLRARDMSLFAAMGLDRRANSSFTNLHLAGINLKGQGWGEPLLSCGDSSGLTVLHVSRQLEAEALQAESSGLVFLKGMTASTIQNDLTFSWLQDLAAAFPSTEEPAVSPQEDHLLGSLTDSDLEDDESAVFGESSVCLTAAGATSSGKGDLESGDLSSQACDESSKRLRDEEAEPRGSDDLEKDRVAGDESQQPSWVVRLENCAIRDDGLESPDDESPRLDAALLVGALRWQSAKAAQRTVVSMQSLTLLAAEREPPSCLTPTNNTSRRSSMSQPLDLCHSRLLEFGYLCLAQEGHLKLSIQTPSGEPDGKSGQSFSVIELQNKRLHCQLTSKAFHRLKALLTRLSSQSASRGENPESKKMRTPRNTTSLIGEDENSFTMDTRLRSGSGTRPTTPSAAPVAVLAEIEENAFLGRGSADGEDPAPQEDNQRYFIPVASGGTSLDDESDVPGGAPVLIEDFFKKYHQEKLQRQGSQSSPKSEAAGLWYGERGGTGQPPTILEEWVKQPPPGYHPPSERRSALDPLPASYPVPCSRFVLNNLSLAVALCEEEQGNGAQPATISRVELELEDFSLQSDTFDPESEHKSRLAISVGRVELKDCSQHAETSKGWHKIFSQHVSLNSPRNPETCFFLADLETVRPDQGNEELRLKVSCLPLRLRLDQNVVCFLQSFFSEQPGKDSLFDSFEKVDLECAEEEETEPGSSVFVQRCDIKPITVVIDYKPRRVDVTALRAGNVTEVINMTAWSDVEIVLPGVRLVGVQGWHTVGSSVLQKYINDVVSKQVGSFVAGIKPLQSIIRVGSAAGQLLAIPAEALRGRPDSAYSKNTKNVPMSRQLQRGTIGLVQAIIAEVLGISAGALGGLHLVLSGPAAAERPSYQAQPPNMKEGMRQASQRLASGIGEMGAALKSPFTGTEAAYTHSRSRTSRVAKALRAAPGALAKPISEGAAAARLTILGARNSIDPVRFEKRKQER